MKTQLEGQRRQILDLTESNTKTEAKMSATLENVRQLQDEKANIETKLNQKQASLNIQVMR